MPVESISTELHDIKQRAGHPRFYVLLEILAEIHKRKNMSYARDKEPLSNLHRSKSFGIKPSHGAMIRMSDKWSRIEEFVGGGKPDVTGEGLPDALLDNAVYSLISLLLLEEERHVRYQLSDDCRLTPVAVEGTVDQ